MPTIFAIAIVFLLVPLALAPLLLAYNKPKAALPVAFIYCACALSLAFYHFGLFNERLQTIAPAEPQRLASAPAELCAEALRLSERDGLVLDRSDPNRLVVNANLWQQVPKLARDALVRCAEAVRNPEAEGPIDLVVENPAP